MQEDPIVLIVLKISGPVKLEERCHANPLPPTHTHTHTHTHAFLHRKKEKWKKIR